MADNLVYMYGKVAKAVEILITNHHDIRNRIWVASEYLMLVDADALPESCREDVEWIHHMLTRYHPESPDETPLDATFRRTRNQTAYKIAKRVWRLYHVMDTEIDMRQKTEREFVKPSWRPNE